MAKAVNLQAKVVTGWSKGYGFKIGQTFEGKRTDHAWSAVKLGDKWALLDCCWAAGHLRGRQFQKKLNEHYFLTPPAAFIFDHLPEDTGNQYLKPILSQKEFSKLVKVNAAFWRCGLSLMSHKEAIIVARKGKNIQITLGGALKAGILTNYEGMSGRPPVSVSGDVFTISWAPKNTGKLTVFAKLNSESGSYWGALEYLVNVK